jgi:hypothetical protein
MDPAAHPTQEFSDRRIGSEKNNRYLSAIRQKE